MKRTFAFAIVCMLFLSVNAQLTDAFKGIYPVTDKAMMKSLNGQWKLKVVREGRADKNVPFVDASWGTIAVPGCWEAHGFCKPRYNYPDSLTGYYRTSFTLPEGWKDKQVVLRFDGVLRGYELWLNGKRVGTWESGFNTCQFNLTSYLTKKAYKGEPQLLALISAVSLRVRLLRASLRRRLSMLPTIRRPTS